MCFRRVRHVDTGREGIVIKRSKEGLYILWDDIQSDYCLII